MRKLLCALLVLGLLLMTGTALAAKPTVSFVSKSGAMNGGFDYELAIKIDQAPEADLPVAIKNGTTEEIFTITIPAGQTKASVKIPTEPVKSRTSIKFTLQKNDAYSVGASHTLNVHALPKIEFYTTLQFGRLGRTMRVQIECSNTQNIIKGNNTLQLRTSEGVVLAEKAWPMGQKQTFFNFDVTEELLGRRNLSVWLGDNCVTEKETMAFLVEPSNGVVRSMEPKVPVMAIGLDCGSSAGAYKGILEVLEKHNVTATFFMTGEFIRYYTDAAKEIIAAGHEPGNHSNSHPRMNNLSAQKMHRELMRPIEDMEERLGVTPRLFRPPYGAFNTDLTSLCHGEGMESILWTIDWRDSFVDYTPTRVEKRATTGFDYVPGTIILGHLTGIGMPEVLDAALTYYESLGYKIVPISAMYYLSGREHWPLPSDREALVYTDDYWPNWIRENLPEYAWVLDE